MNKIVIMLFLDKHTELLIIYVDSLVIINVFLNLFVFWWQTQELLFYEIYFILYT